jgi:cytochrome c peroxidase
MKKNLLWVGVALFFMMVQACQQKSEKQVLQEKRAYKEAQRADAIDAWIFAHAPKYFGSLPTEATNPENPCTEPRVELGKQLYFDTRLSKNGTISCNSCHNLATYGVDNDVTSTGDTGKKGGRNSPTVFNAALNTFQFWDGRAKDVEAQAGMPILNPIEMGIPHPDFLMGRLAEIPGYQDAFKKAFPQDANPFTYANLAKAIGAFERTLITPSRYDQYMAGELQALSAKEKQGLKVFVETGCIQCHVGPSFGGSMFQKFGVHDDYWKATGSKAIDKGLADQSGKAEDAFRFKVPGLRNVEKTWPYFHDGSVQSLEEAVKIMSSLQLNKTLTEVETNQMVAFLKSLTADIPEQVKTPPKPL